MPQLNQELILALPKWARKHRLPVVLTIQSTGNSMGCFSPVGMGDIRYMKSWRKKALPLLSKFYSFSENDIDRSEIRLLV